MAAPWLPDIDFDDGEAPGDDYDALPLPTPPPRAPDACRQAGAGGAAPAPTRAPKKRAAESVAVEFPRDSEPVRAPKRPCEHWTDAVSLSEEDAESGAESDADSDVVEVEPGPEPDAEPAARVQLFLGRADLWRHPPESAGAAARAVSRAAAGRQLQAGRRRGKGMKRRKGSRWRKSDGAGSRLRKRSSGRRGRSNDEPILPARPPTPPRAGENDGAERRRGRVFVLGDDRAAAKRLTVPRRVVTPTVPAAPIGSASLKRTNADIDDEFVKLYADPFIEEAARQVADVWEGAGRLCFGSAMPTALDL